MGVKISMYTFFVKGTTGKALKGEKSQRLYLSASNACIYHMGTPCLPCHRNPASSQPPRETPPVRIPVSSLTKVACTLIRNSVRNVWRVPQKDDRTVSSPTQCSICQSPSVKPLPQAGVGEQRGTQTPRAKQVRTQATLVWEASISTALPTGDG